MAAQTSRTSQFGQSASAMLKRAIGLLLLFAVFILVLKFAVGMAIGFVTSVLGIILVAALVIGGLWLYRKT